MGTKQIDEDGLLDLIRTLPSPSKMAGKKTTATAASKKIKAKSKSKSPAPGPAKLPSVKSHDPQPATPISSQLTSTRSFYGSAPSTSPSVAKPSSGKSKEHTLHYVGICDCNMFVASLATSVKIFLINSMFYVPF